MSEYLRPGQLVIWVFEGVPLKARVVSVFRLQGICTVNWEPEEFPEDWSGAHDLLARAIAKEQWLAGEEVTG